MALPQPFVASPSFQGLPTDVPSLAQYCLEQLGAPVIQVDVSQDQISNRIAEAINFCALYLWELSDTNMFIYQVQPSVLTLSVPVSSLTSSEQPSFTTSQSKIAGTLNLTASGNVVTVRSAGPALRDFIVGETILINGSPATITAYTAGDPQKGWIQTPPNLLGVQRIVTLTGGYNSEDIFNIQYQLRLNDLFNLGAVDIVYYVTAMQYLDLLNLQLNGHTRFRWNRYTQQLHLDWNWQFDVMPGQFLAIEGWSFVDPAQYPLAYGDPYLIRLATALIKKQWGNNLKKFQGMQLPGGITLNGADIYREAVDEEKEIKEEIMTKVARPLGFMMG